MIDLDQTSSFQLLSSFDQTATNCCEVSNTKSKETWLYRNARSPLVCVKLLEIEFHVRMKLIIGVFPFSSFSFTDMIFMNFSSKLGSSNMRRMHITRESIYGT